MSSARPAALLLAALLSAAGARAAPGSEASCATVNTDRLTLLADPFEPTQHAAPVFDLRAAGTGAAAIVRFTLNADGTLSERPATHAAAGFESTAVRSALYTDRVLGPLRTASNAIGVAAGSELSAAVATDAALEAALLPAAITAVDYGGTRAHPDGADAVLYVATAAGFIEALDARSGELLWVFAPQPALRAPIAVSVRPPARRAAAVLRPYRFDRNGDGVIERAAGDRVYLIVASGAAEPVLFGLDVTDRAAPLLLWRDDRGVLARLGLPRAAPAIARLRAATSASNPLGLVAVLGSGAAADGRGALLYILDLLSGAPLARVGAPAGAARAREVPAEAARGFEAGVNVLDLDGDGFADRIYAADSGGQLWRFDVHDAEPAARLITARLFAMLGSEVGVRRAQPRGFYQTPDAALITAAGARFLTLALSSGDGAAAADDADFLYVLRDYDLGSYATEAAMPRAPPVITRADLGDTAVATGAAGWRRRLAVGEYATAPVRTAAGFVYLTTARAHGAAGCAAGSPGRRLYIAAARDGASPEGVPAAGIDLTGGADSVVFAFAPRATTAADRPPGAVCFVGLTRCGQGVAGRPVPGVWSERQAP